MMELSSDGLQQTQGGVYLPPKPTMRAWIKLRGEPALVLYENPAQVMTRWVEFLTSDRSHAIFHDHAYGEMTVFFRSAITEIAFIGVTHPTTEQGRTGPTSIYAGLCPCAEFGGPCAPLAQSALVVPGSSELKTKLADAVEKARVKR